MQTTSNSEVGRNTRILIAAVVLTFVALRIVLSLCPNSDFDIAGYNIHHLFTGLVFITLGGIPLAVFRGTSRRLDLALVTFGIGLAMALDEWVYLIATDGSNSSYLLPVSFWGGLVVILTAIGYTMLLVAQSAKTPVGEKEKQ